MSRATPKQRAYSRKVDDFDWYYCCEANSSVKKGTRRQRKKWLARLAKMHKVFSSRDGGRHQIWWSKGRWNQIEARLEWRDGKAMLPEAWVRFDAGLCDYCDGYFKLCDC
jgi:hypothetical protein